MPRTTNSPTIASGSHTLTDWLRATKVSSTIGFISQVKPPAAAASTPMPMKASTSSGHWRAAYPSRRR